MNPHCFVLVLVSSASLLTGLAAPGKRELMRDLKFHPGRVLVRPKADHRAIGPLTQLHDRARAKVLKTFARVGGLQVVELPPGADVRMAIETYRGSGLVEYAEPDYEVKVAAVPNDPQYLNGAQWGLNQIDAPQGWSIRHQAMNIIVAVIDTGIRCTHQDLSSNLWVNPGEIPGNGIDDDGDGFIDDVHGINAIDRTGDPTDDNGHGTHVAGTIGAVGNNGLGVVGVAWKVQLMGCKFLNQAGSGWDSDAILCIEYAQTHGASVMNNSWGGGGYSQALMDAIAGAGMAGILFVAAAGNSSIDTDSAVFYPAGYGCDNLVSVAATTRSEDLAYFSNFGSSSVDIGAPGLEILSSWNASDSAYHTISGTSMATPHVSGVLALMQAQFPGESPLQILNRVYGSVDALPALVGKCRAGGRINLYKALNSSSSRPANDDFANRILLTRESFSIQGINVDASNEPGEPVHGGMPAGPGGRSIWWAWHPPLTGIATISTIGTRFPTVLGVYEGGQISDLTSVPNDQQQPGADLKSTVTFEVLAGEEYQLAVDGVNGATGNVVMNVSLTPRPLNDNFTNRVAISGSLATVSGSNSLATSEAQEPSHCGQRASHSVWWSWTPAVSRGATITTAGSGFNTLLAVYTGNDLLTLREVASNDDDPVAGTLQSRVSFDAVAGTTYQIAVDGSEGVSGNITLNTPPSNDDFAQRIMLNGVNPQATGFNCIASREADEPSHAGKTPAKSLWWSWTAPISGRASVLTLGSTFDTVLAVYTGSELNSLSPTGVNDNDPYGNFTSMLNFDAVQGATYQIAVDGVDGASGKVVLQVAIGGQYVLTDVGVPAGYSGSAAYSVNLSGVVVGSYFQASGNMIDHPFIWMPSQGLRPLMDETVQGEACDINDFNQVVGWMITPKGQRAFLWQNGVTRELGALDPNGLSGANAIDNQGRVIGWSNSSLPGMPRHAFLWQDGIMTDLGALPEEESAAYGLNQPGYVVGAGNPQSGSSQSPIVWRNYSRQNLPLPEGATDGLALSVNELCEVVGSCTGELGKSYVHQVAVMWQEGIPSLLGGVGPVGDSFANSINNLGQIVGDDGHFNAALRQNGRWTYLNELLPGGSDWTSLMMAYKITDRGQIVGAGLKNSSWARGYVMTPLVQPTPRALIKWPTDGQSFLACADLTVRSHVIPDAANLVRVEFLVGNNVIGTATSAPYDIVWSNLPPGDFTLSARTIGISGGTSLSQLIHVSVVANTLLFPSMPDQELLGLVQMTVAAKATDPDRPNQMLKFSLISAPAGMSIHPEGGVISWTPNGSQSPSTNLVLVKVTDDGVPVFSATNAFIVVVKEVHRAPVLPSLPAVVVDELGWLAVTNAALEAGFHDSLEYRLIDAPSGAVIDSFGIITWSPTEAQAPATYSITTVITGTDPYDTANPQLSATNTFAVIVNEKNAAPLLPILPDQALDELTALTITNTATDPDLPANPLSYSLINPPAGASIDARGIINWTPSEAQGPATNVIVTVVTDSNPDAANYPHLSATNRLVVVVHEVNAPPVPPVIPDQLIGEWDDLSLTNSAADPDLPANVLRYQLLGAPMGAAIDGQGLVTWSPAQTQSPSTNLFTIVVTDTNLFDLAQPQLSATNSFWVVVKEVNRPPVMPQINQQKVDELRLLRVTNSAAPANIRQSLSYELSRGPTGLTIDPEGVISWTPSEDEGPGTNTVTTVVTGTDPYDTANPQLSATNVFTVVVNELNSPPLLSAILNQTVGVGHTVEISNTASDLDVPANALIYSLVSAPASASLDVTSGVFSWRVPVCRAGTSNYIQLCVTDDGNPPLSSTQSFAIFINQLPPVTLAPIINAGGLFLLQLNGPVGLDYTVQTAAAPTNGGWVDWVTVRPDSLPFNLNDASVASFTNRFYRVRLGP